MNEAQFYAAVRAALGKLTQAQVEGFGFLLVALAGVDMRHAAYILATAWHETARTMQPIAEYGRGKGRPYGKADITGKAPYGRGYVQLTWRGNYVKADQELALGGRLAGNYDLALQPDIAAQILVRGMIEGWFTRKRLADFATYTDMRKVVNGTDKASVIAGYAVKFEAALAQAGWGVTPPPAAETPPAVTPTAPTGLLKALLDLLAALFTKKG